MILKPNEQLALKLFRNTLTIDELAKKAMIHRNTISYWIRGKKKPHKGTIKKIKNITNYFNFLGDWNKDKDIKLTTGEKLYIWKLRTGFENNDISDLLGISPQQVTNVFSNRNVSDNLLNKIETILSENNYE